MSKKSEKDRITVRLEPYEKFLLDQLTKSLGIGAATLVRIIVKNFIEKNEDALDRIIEKYNEKKCQQ